MTPVSEKKLHPIEIIPIDGVPMVKPDDDLAEKSDDWQDFIF